MNKIFLVIAVGVVGIAAFFLFQSPQTTPVDMPEQSDIKKIVLPVEEYVSRRTFNGFGELSQASVTGYHVAEDIEYVDMLSEEIPVVAIADGVVLRIGSAAGYGGVAVVMHEVEGQDIGAIYGHLDVSSTNLSVGDTVSKGQFIANLGDHESAETDGERKHLHFGLYEGSEERIKGYEVDIADIDGWLNPHDFFASHEYDMDAPARTFDPGRELGGGTYHIEFSLPAGWEIEYVRSLDALNLYTLSGSGTARERSQILIQHFDASDFLTLSTVTIHQVQDALAGAEYYKARRYDIEKKEDVPNFGGQPSWRNTRHIATDLRAKDGFARYYTVAANPELDETAYEAVLASIRIVE
jgi:hypothetical protein